MTGALGPALTILTSLVIITYSGCLITILLLGDYFIPFFGALDYGSKFAAALLIACLSVARSPSSAIAIISELNAKVRHASSATRRACASLCRTAARARQERARLQERAR